MGPVVYWPRLSTQGGTWCTSIGKREKKKRKRLHLKYPRPINNLLECSVATWSSTSYQFSVSDPQREEDMKSFIYRFRTCFLICLLDVFFFFFGFLKNRDGTENVCRLPFLFLGCISACVYYRLARSHRLCASTFGGKWVSYSLTFAVSVLTDKKTGKHQRISICSDSFIMDIITGAE